MAGRGRLWTFHGAFNRKADAERKEKSRPGSFIKMVKIHGRTRYAVAEQPGADRVRIKF